MRAPTFVTVRLDAALVRDLRRVLCMEGDLKQSPRNTLAVETAMLYYVGQRKAYDAHLKGGA